MKKTAKSMIILFLIQLYKCITLVTANNNGSNNDITILLSKDLTGAYHKPIPFFKVLFVHMLSRSNCSFLYMHAKKSTK